MYSNSSKTSPVLVVVWHYDRDLLQQLTVIQKHLFSVNREESASERTRHIVGLRTEQLMDKTVSDGMTPRFCFREISKLR